MISQHTIQEITNHIDIIDIVGSYVKLKKRGSNYLGLCPFHNEKTPSFTVSPSKEIYKCFGCGKSGNGIGFIMELEKYSYVEALRWLANRYNIPIEETAVSPEQLVQRQSADSLYIINQFAQQFFTEVLFETEEGQDIGLSYLRERGFREEIIRKFQLGFNPEARDHFSKAALKAQYNLENLQKSGLVVVRDGQPQDNYRGRIIFPVHNQSGKILGFGARILKTNDRAPKYINTPENEIYVKSKILYGSYFARQAIDKADECLLVEGYTDVISLHQAGVENVVASGGTSLTPDQLRLIKKFTNNLTIVYDGDGAGIKAALRGLDLALEEGLNVKLVLIPDKEDPDSYVNKVGATAFRDFITANKKDVILFQLEILLKDAGTDSVRKSQVVNQIAETIGRLNKAEDFTRQQDYIRQCSALLQIEESGLHALVNKIIREKLIKEENRQQKQQPVDPDIPGVTESVPDAVPPDAAQSDAQALLSPDERHERAMLRSLIEFGLRPWNEQLLVADYIAHEFTENTLHEFFDNQQLLGVYDEYMALYRAGKQPDSKYFLYHSDPAITALTVQLLEFGHELSPNWKKFYEGKIDTREELYRDEVESTLNYLILRKVKRMLEENSREIQKVTSPIDLKVLLESHLSLKELEQQLTLKIGTVILK